MTDILKLKDPITKWRTFLAQFRTNPQPTIIQDDDNQEVGVVLPMEYYRLLDKEWKAGFKGVEEIRARMQKYDPDYIQQQIDNAVEEVKAASRPNAS